MSIPEREVTVIPETTYVVADDEELEKPYRVIICNDDVTPMEFVVMVLRRFFDLSDDHAVEIMWQAHTRGEAHVVTLPFAEAQQRVYAAHSAARAASYPLTFYLEPDQ